VDASNPPKETRGVLTVGISPNRPLSGIIT